MAGRQVREPETAAGAVDEGDDRGLVALPGDQVAFPVADAAALLHGGRAVVDQLDEDDEPRTPLAQRAADAQPAGELPAPPAVVKSLADALMADVSGRLARERQPQPGRDLLRAPLQLQLCLDFCAAGRRLAAAPAASGGPAASPPTTSFSRNGKR